MNPPDKIKDARMGIAGENIQEILDAAATVGNALQNGQNQFQTPDWLARGLAALLPHGNYSHVLDPQCAGGNLLMAVPSYSGINSRMGIELDRRFLEEKKQGDAFTDTIARITGNCVKVMATFDDIAPTAQFNCIVANPPFAIRWKLPDGTAVDSTQWTWDLIKKRLSDNGSGFLISNYNTLERLGITRDPWVYLSQRFPVGGVWDNVNVQLGIVHFYNGSLGFPRVDRDWTHVPSERELADFSRDEEMNKVANAARYPYGHGGVTNQWQTLQKVIAEEHGSHPKWNIYLNKDGMLRTYLSTRSAMKVKQDEIARLARINGCHPLTLTTERETRKLMHEYLTAGTYTIQPEARTAITAALAEVASLACPLRPVTDFESVAYAEEEEQLKCKAASDKIALTPGKFYEIRTGTYTFKDTFSRKKVHYDEETGKTEIEEHDCELSGEDRYIEITDDRRCTHRFMDRPDQSHSWQHPEAMLWEIFQRPYVPTVAEVCAEQYECNLNAMKFNEMVAGFTYFVGQLDYYARMACKDYGLVAADVGTGKSLGALTLITLKSPKRTLLIAPQGTMRSVGDEDEVDYQASQWVKEIQRFAPGEPVFQLFDDHDLGNILHANGGELPAGIYITYPQAFFSNGAFEHLPHTWEGEEESRFCKRFGYEFTNERAKDDYYSRNIGAASDKGIRCIWQPSLATLIECRFGDVFEMVVIDEAHLCCNLEANITKNLLRLQPKYRFALTATPIPNIVSNIFSLMGWLCVPGWHKGGIRNAAWPYAVDEIGRFNTTFLSTEVDLTAQQKARAAGKKSWRQSGTRFSPIISSPARLLKLLKPSMAYISKEDCNPNVVGCEIIDVRVATGKEQSKLYEYWLNRANYVNEFKSMLTIAQVQSSRLRGVCASPATLDYTRGLCKSNFNRKTVTILQLIRDCLQRGEQVVVVSARVGQSAALATRLNDCSIPISRIDSTVAAELHTAEANRFKKGDSRVMLMGIKCAQGHSFDQCPNLIIGSLEWSYGTLHQAKGRVWRLTSPKQVKIWCVLHKNTIEELLFDRVALKQDAATLCLHGKRVPRDFKTLDAAEILAEHIVNFDAKDGEVLSESECESQWHALRKQLVIANRSPRQIEATKEAA